MQSRSLGLAGVVLFLGAAASLSLANSFGPQLGRTGAPAVGTYGAEPTCNDAGCHSGNPLNQSGTLEILGVPSTYTPGRDYTLTVQLNSTATTADATRKWGFELTAVRMNDGKGAGSFSSPDLLVSTGTLNGGSRPYISHDTDTNLAGQASPAVWTFTWTAPAQQAGPVGFFAAGNAANGDVTNLGDHIYTAASGVSQAVTPVAPVTWGRLKRLFETAP